MLNCAEPGSTIWYSRSDNPKRKYPNTFELVETEDGSLAGINTGKANALVREALEAGLIKELKGYAHIKSEVRYGSENSRIDFCLSGNDQDERDCFVEVKSVTLGLGNGLGMFPDAVTARGSKHLRELIQVHQQGNRAVLLFCVQHTGIERVEPADDIDPVYAATLKDAVKSGVEVLAYRADISPEEIKLTRAIPVQIR